MTDPTTTEPSVLRKLLPKLVISLILGGLFAWLAASGGVPLVPPRESLGAVKWWTVPAYAGTLLVTHFLRASRWRYLIRPVQRLPLKDVIALNWVGFFAIFALPLRLGEISRPALTKLRHGISVSAGLGTVAVERVVDGLVTSVCVAWALFVLPRVASDDPIAQRLPIYGYASLAVFTSAFIALGVFLWKRSLAVTLTQKVIGLVSPRLATVLADKVGGVADGVRSLGDARLASGFLFETALYWLSNATGMWLLAWGCGIPMHLSHAIALMGILAIGILLPTGPGLFGNFQLAVSTGLKLYFAESIVGSQGAVYIFLLYTVQTTLIILAGVIPLYSMKISFGQLMGADAVRQSLTPSERP